MSDQPQVYDALSPDEVPRFLAYLNKQLDAAGLVIVPKDILLIEQQKFIRQIQVREVAG